MRGDGHFSAPGRGALRYFSNQFVISRHQTTRLAGLVIQCPSSGKKTYRLGTPRRWRAVNMPSPCASAMTAFLLTQNETGLFTVAAVFGLGFSGIIPAYVLAVRELFPASEASWRIPTFLLFSGSGMAIGGWLAGLLYDHFGYYAPAFAVGIGTNLLNLLIVSVLVGRKRQVAV